MGGCASALNWANRALPSAVITDPHLAGDVVDIYTE